MDFDFTNPLPDSDEEFNFGKSNKSITFNILSSDDESNGPTQSDDFLQSHNNDAISQEITVKDSSCDKENSPVLSIQLVNKSDDSGHNEDPPHISRRSPLKNLDPDIFDAEEDYDAEQSEDENLPAFDPRIFDVNPPSDEEPKDNCEVNNSQDEITQSKPKKKRERKKTKKENPQDTREVIQREAQRLVRETNISLPYHIPRQRTLSDFLSRRPTPLGRLKAVPVSAVWKNLEEREKEVEELYKSESSEDERPPEMLEPLPEKNETPEDKPTENAFEGKDKMVKNCEPEEKSPENTKDVVKETSSSAEAGEICTNSEEVLCRSESNEIVSKSENDVKLICEEAADSCMERFSVDNFSTSKISPTDNPKSCINQESEPFCFQVDTEDILDTPTELPCKLSFPENESEQASQEVLTKSLLDHLNNKKNNKTSELLTELVDGKIVDTIEKSMINAQLTLVPKLSADKDNIVDLDVDASKKPGKVGLIQRFIKHVKLKPKKKEEVKLCLVTAETGGDGEVISISEDTVVVQTKKTESGPNCLTALKRSLHNSVLSTRSAIINKKMEQQRFFETESFDENSVDKILDEVDKENDEEVENEESEGDEEDGDLLEDDVDMSDKKRTTSDYLDEEAEESEGDEVEDEGMEGDDENEEDDVKEKEIKLPEFSQDDESVSPFPTSIEGLCSGAFPSQPIDFQKLKNMNNGASEDFSQDLFSQRSEENTRVIIDEDEGETISVKKVARRLVISDDEDDGNGDGDIGGEDSSEDPLSDEVENGAEGEEKEDEELEDNGDDEESSVNGEISSDDEGNNATEDSKHNHVRKLEYNSEEELVEAANFLEKEAELSGSEWESEDEDEKGLSDFEADEADLEKIDQRKLKSELDKMYMQDILMEDKREVRLLKELLLEDGELHSEGPKRQRLYRWSSQGNTSNLVGGGVNSDDDGAAEDVEEDLSWRQARSEREQFVSSHSSQSEEVSDVTVKVTREITSKKIQAASEKPPTSDAASPDFKLKSLLTAARRGSFLGRGAMLARMAAAANQEVDGRARTGRNMVFAAVSPPKPSDISEPQPEVKKRKAEEVKNVTKKLKFNPIHANKRTISLLDKLREF